MQRPEKHVIFETVAFFLDLPSIDTVSTCGETDFTIYCLLFSPSSSSFNEIKKEKNLKIYVEMQLSTHLDNVFPCESSGFSNAVKST